MHLFIRIGKKIVRNRTHFEDQVIEYYLCTLCLILEIFNYRNCFFNYNIFYTFIFIDLQWNFFLIILTLLLLLFYSIKFIFFLLEFTIFFWLFFFWFLLLLLLVLIIFNLIFLLNNGIIILENFYISIINDYWIFLIECPVYPLHFLLNLI